MYMYMIVYVSMYSFGCKYIKAYVWRSENNLHVGPHPCSLFKASPFLFPTAYVRLASWQAFRDSTVSLPFLL